MTLPASLQIPAHWLSHGFWNTLEHALTRIADALTTFLLIWVLAPEVFSELAFAQALVAPCLFLFLSPETVIYRDYARWEAEGTRSLTARLNALRLFGWAKLAVATVIAATIANLYPLQPQAGIHGSGSALRFFTLLWAFAIVLAPQICGPDREYLRLSLHLKTLNTVSLLQKISVLGGTALVAWFAPLRFDLFAAVSVLAVLVSASFAFWRVHRVLANEPRLAQSATAPSCAPPSMRTTLKDALGTFSIWSHLSGVITQWVQTMDLFFLGVFQFPARTVGLYAVALKLSNLATALPMALSNLFAVRTGRRLSTPENLASERGELRRFSLLLLLANLGQGAVLFLLGKFLISLLSHGRYSPEEHNEIFLWFGWILLGTLVWSSTFLLTAWLSVRKKIQTLFLGVYLPWGLLSAGLFVVALRTSDQTATTAAILHFSISLLFVALLGLNAKWKKSC